MRRLAFTGAADVVAPGGELFTAFFRRDGIFIRHIIHGTAEGVKRRHGVALYAGQQDEGEREVRRAFPGDGAALLHDYKPAGGEFRSSRLGGSPPHSASVGLSWRFS